MKIKKMKRLLSILMCIAMLVSLMPAAAMAASSLSGGKAEWNVQLSGEGVLTWNAVANATSYDVNVDETEAGGTVTKIEGINTNEYNLIDWLRNHKIETGNYCLYIEANGTDKTSGDITFNYISPEPKLSAPQNLRWDGNVAKWDSVAGATEYEVRLYRESGSLQLRKTTTETQYDWSTNVYNDGFWFEVIATADGYRNSNAAEGPRYGNYSWTAPSLSGGNAAWNVQLSDEGVLTWNAVANATSYDIEVDKTAMGGTVTNIYGINSNSYNLIDRFKELKIENGMYYFTIKANGPGTNSGTISFRYVSPEPKLSAPQNLYWNGTVAKWNSVANATEYTVRLYSDSGSLQLSKTTSDTQYDWSTNVYNDGFWFEVVATADGYRDSDAAEGPAKYDLFTPINAISLQGLSVPVVGEHINSVHGSNLTEALAHSYKYEVIDNQYSDWKDEEGRAILYGQQCFEAGRTYSISFNIEPKDGYAFTSTDIPVELSNLYPYQYTGNITLNKESKIATVTFTFELGGERTYEDINAFRFYNVREPKDGDQVAPQGVWAYNNSEMTDRYWTDSNGTRLESGSRFEGGNNYSYNFVFTAFDGYKFADSVSIRNDTNIVDWQYSFNADNTKIYITIPYYVKGSTIVSSITVNGMFIPVQGSTTGAFDAEAYMSAPDNANYEVANQLNDWFEADAEYVIDSELKVAETGFIVGKQYKMFLLIYADEDYKFASPENVSFTLSGIPENIYSYTCRQAGPEDIIEVAITFTAQFPPGTGTINNPVNVTSYDELKYALENPDIQGIVVNSFENDPYQTFYTLEKGKDFKAGNLAITVPSGSTKYLTINADINIRVPYVDYLLYSFIGNYGDLTIGGTGSLNVSMNARGYPSAILYNSGNLEIGGNVTFDPTNKSFDSVHGYSVINNQGKTVINNGTFIGYDASAVMYLNGSMDIYGGTFEVKNGDEDAFGLNTDSHLTVEDHDVNLYGGTFEGIRADQSTGAGIVKLPDLLAYGGYYTYDGSGNEFNPFGLKDTHETLVVKMNIIIDDVALTIDPPKQNGTPAQSVTAGGNGYKKALGNDAIYWTKSDDGETWTSMNSNETFSIGKYYRVAIDVMALNGYVFDIDPQIEPNVAATINGYYAEVLRYPEEDPSELICVRYNFGILNDNIIEQIDIDGVIEPVVGEHPNYNCAISGSGYTINNAYSNGTYVINGICWRDVTFDMWVKPDMTFQIGHEYKVFVDVKTEDGYEFYTTTLGGSYPPAGWGYINGNYATLGMQYDGRYEQSLSWTFTCQPKTIKSVAVSGLDAPQAGKTPDLTMTLGEPEFYTLGSITWECDGTEMEATDTFEKGNSYFMYFDILPVKIGEVNSCKFVANTKVYIDGKKVPDNDVSVVPSSKNGRVRVFRYYDNLMQNGVEVSGTVISWNNTDDTVIRMYPGTTSDDTIKSDIKLATSGVAGTVTATKGNITANADGKRFNQTYSVSDVETGVYKIAIYKPGKYVPKIIEIDVSGDDFDAGTHKLWLYGDVTYDGKVNGTDAVQIRRKFAGLTPNVFTQGTAEDQADRLEAANVTGPKNGDTVINGTDAVQIQRYFAHLSPSVFDNII